MGIESTHKQQILNLMTRPFPDKNQQLKFKLLEQKERKIVPEQKYSMLKIKHICLNARRNAFQ